MKAEDKSSTSESPVQVWFSIEDNSSNQSKTKVVAKKLSRTSKKTVTAEEIQKKLKDAETRRLNQLRQKSKQATESREQMLILAKKIDKLHQHEVLSKGKVVNQDSSKPILSKREYTKLAGEISMEFDSLSQRYTQDLNKAEACRLRHSSENSP